MPNIQIHGLSVYTAGTTKDDIVSAIKNLPFAADAVITIVPSKCVDIKGNPQPFLRICSPEKSRFRPLVKALKPLKLDIETLLLSGFYPKGL